MIDTLIDWYVWAEASPVVAPALRIMVLLVIGIPLVRYAARRVRLMTLRRGSAQGAMLASKVCLYGGIIAILAAIFYDLGFNLTAIVGAAGVLGVAIGFASQTSLSNIISGAFLISERPFTVGEVIQIDGLIGTVLSIDLLSVKVRTPDNKFIRIPNEQLVKGVITTINRYPIRRLDIRLSVAYKEDVARVRAILKDIADRNPLCLDEPRPLILFDAFGDSGLDFLFAVWVVRENFLELKNAMMDAVKARFDSEGIEIPFPHISLYAGSETAPFPVRVVDGGAVVSAPVTAVSDQR